MIDATGEDPRPAGKAGGVPTPRDSHSLIDMLSRARAALLVVDIQDRLIPAMPEPARDQLLRNTAILIEAAHRLGLPIVVSQQYPKGLGPTVQAIEDALAAAQGAAPSGSMTRGVAAKNGGAAVHRFDKHEFSAAASPEFAALLPKLGRDQWIVCGMEAHVCVYQTARALVGRGYQVHVCADAVASRTKLNWKIGLGLVERAGAIVSSTEVCVFDLLGRRIAELAFVPEGDLWAARWTTSDASGSPLRGGVYFARAGHATARIVVLGP